MWNNNISIIGEEYRFRLDVDGWAQMIDIYEKKQRTKYANYMVQSPLL
jgi:hypothetical protein